MNSMRMGHVIDLGGKKLSELDTEDFYNKVIQKLWENGVICVKGQSDLSLDEYIECVGKIGFPVKLPPQLAFNNTQPNYPEVVRVGNVTSSGEVLQKYQSAEYWHTDGDFWPSPKNFIVNWLLSIHVPKSGGETAFMDMQQIYDSLSVSEKEEYSKMSFTINLDEISDFKGITPEEIGFPKITSHSTILDQALTNKRALYLSSDDAVLNYPNGKKEIAKEMIKEYAGKFPLYVHKWNKGDLLLWDNTQVMHRGLGGFGDSPRLLYRCQSRITPFFINIMKRFI